jgi:hypothetical protein
MGTRMVAALFKKDWEKWRAERKKNVALNEMPLLCFYSWKSSPAPAPAPYTLYYAPKENLDSNVNDPAILCLTCYFTSTSNAFASSINTL